MGMDALELIITIYKAIFKCNLINKHLLLNG